APRRAGRRHARRTGVGTRQCAPFGPAALARAARVMARRSARSRRGRDPGRTPAAARPRGSPLRTGFRNPRQSVHPHRHGALRRARGRRPAIDHPGRRRPRRSAGAQAPAGHRRTARPERARRDRRRGDPARARPPTLTGERTTDMTSTPPETATHPPTTLHVDWDVATGRSHTTLTTHLWTAPQLRRDSPIHDKAFEALRDLRVDLARFLPWFSHPRLAVPELTPPSGDTTSWNFELLDPLVEDFMAAAEGRPVVANFATIPTWMFVTPEPVPVSDDPDEIHWDYEQGTELRDPTCTEVADYFHRLASWYIAGGFTDELGVWHESGHRYRFAYWEVLCEPAVGHRLWPEPYTRLYDAVVARLAPLAPEMKSVGLSLGHVHPQPEYYWHFLDAANHADGVPIDAFSYHFYAQPEIVNPFGLTGNAPYQHWRDIFFAQA